MSQSITGEISDKVRCKICKETFPDWDIFGLHVREAHPEYLRPQEPHIVYLGSPEATRMIEKNAEASSKKFTENLHNVKQFMQTMWKATEEQMKPKVVEIQQESMKRIEGFGGINTQFIKGHKLEVKRFQTPDEKNTLTWDEENSLWLNDGEIVVINKEYPDYLKEPERIGRDIEHLLWRLQMTWGNEEMFGHSGTKISPDVMVLETQTQDIIERAFLFLQNFTTQTEKLTQDRMSILVVIGKDSRNSFEKIQALQKCLVFIARILVMAIDEWKEAINYHGFASGSYSFQSNIVYFNYMDPDGRVFKKKMAEAVESNLGFPVPPEPGDFIKEELDIPVPEQVYQLLEQHGPMAVATLAEIRKVTPKAIREKLHEIRKRCSKKAINSVTYWATKDYNWENFTPK